MKIFLLYFFSTFCIFMFCYTKFFTAKQYETETTVKLPGVSTEKTTQYDTKTNLTGPPETTTKKIEVVMSPQSVKKLHSDESPSENNQSSGTDKDEQDDKYFDPKPSNLHDQIATPTQFPYYVLARNNKYQCAGSIISPIWILTTAEILSETKTVFITLQPLDRVNSFKVLSTGLLPHPMFQQFPIKYNIGLVKCPEITFNDKINLIKLPTIDSSSDMLTGANFLVVGLRFHVDNVYKTVKILQNPSKCIAGFVCTEYTEAADRPFDVYTGHPLVANTSSGEHFLIGVHTDELEDHVYTSTTIFRQWIKEETGI